MTTTKPNNQPAMFAHIYKAPGKRFTLMLKASSDMSVDSPEDQQHWFDSVREAKSYAKVVGAKAWNY